MSYEVVTEIWSDDILQVGRIFTDSSEDESTKSDDDAQCFTDEFVARVNSKEHLQLSIGRCAKSYNDCKMTFYFHSPILQKTTINQLENLWGYKYGERDSI